MAQVTKLERISNMFCNGILSLFSSELLYTTSNYLDIYKYLHLHVATLKKKGFSLFIIESSILTISKLNSQMSTMNLRQMLYIMTAKRGHKTDFYSGGAAQQFTA